LDSLVDGTFTENLAYYASLDDIPKPIRERAKYVILDGVGCGLFGARLPWSEILTRTIASLLVGGPSTVWDTDLQVPPDHAALRGMRIVMEPISFCKVATVPLDPPPISQRSL
jgi:hypothetical protein